MLMPPDCRHYKFSKSPFSEDVVQLASESNYNTEPTESLMLFLKSEPLCCWILLYYLTDICPLKGRADKTGITRIVKLLPVCADKV